MLLLATRGEDTLPKVRPSSVFFSLVTEHSRKPDVVYQLIEAMYDGPYAELFARRRRPGWEVWGDEVR
ncbi:MAG: MT-A70 family methyltransferase [Armatimonadota bacterium]|nr:MT-A70 family methyltransferase [Armatimonadota bacterium]